MGILDSWQQRKQREGELEQRVFAAFDAAVAAAAAGDIEAEEHALFDALIAAGELGSNEVENTFAQIELITGQGLIRKTEHLGTAANIEVFADRVVQFHPGKVVVCRVDAEVHATVETSGNISVTRGRNLAKKAAGAVLIPGGVFMYGNAKEKTHDVRELYLLIEHPEWVIGAPLDPDAATTARTIATALNDAARRAPRAAAERALDSTASVGPGSGLDPVALLKQLGELHAAGTLTDEEFGQRKATLLARIDASLEH